MVVARQQKSVRERPSVLDPRVLLLILDFTDNDTEVCSVRYVRVSVHMHIHYGWSHAFKIAELLSRDRERERGGTERPLYSRGSRCDSQHKSVLECVAMLIASSCNRTMWAALFQFFHSPIFPNSLPITFCMHELTKFQICWENNDPMQVSTKLRTPFVLLCTDYEQPTDGILVTNTCMLNYIWLGWARSYTSMDRPQNNINKIISNADIVKHFVFIIMQDSG